MNALNIWVEGQLAAVLEADIADYSLRYSDAWKAAGNAFAFSPHLPLAAHHRGAAVKNFFSNLLPEGKPLEALALAHQVRQHDVFGLLRKVGRDCAGALVLTIEDSLPPLPSQFSSSDYQAVSHQQLHEHILLSRAHAVPLMLWDSKRRMSLPGVQNKLGVYIALNNALWLPRDGAATSHILKVGDARHPHMVANEFFCMRLAKAVGMDVPTVQYLALPEPVLLVERYDRLWTPDGALTRLHQIDGCQALNLAPELKYEQPAYGSAPAGATFAQIFKLAQSCNIPASAQFKILQWLLFNYLIGNTDAHAKNISFLVTAHSMKLAPFYDLLSGNIYGYHDMAQSVGGETNLGQIDRACWLELAQTCNINLKFFRAAVRLLSKAIMPALLKSKNQPQAPEIGLVGKKITTIIEANLAVLEAV